MKLLISWLSVVCLVFISTTASAQKPEWAGKGKSSDKGQQYSEQSEEKGHRLGQKITAEQRRQIQDYFKAQSDRTEKSAKGDGKGKDKQRTLPPGLQKKLERGGELPPGWEKKVVVGDRFDRELYEQSEPLPEQLDGLLNGQKGEEYRRIGNKVVKVLEGEGTVVDMIDILGGLSGE